MSQITLHYTEVIHSGLMSRTAKTLHTVHQIIETGHSQQGNEEEKQ